MAVNPARINVTLDVESARRLARLSARTHVPEGTLARSLLLTALEEADPDARTVVELLDSIPGALDRAKLGSGQAQSGDTVPLDKL